MNTDIVLFIGEKDSYIDSNGHIIFPLVVDLNFWIEKNCDRSNLLKRVDNFAGGNREMQAFMFAGGFNEFEVSRFVRRFKSRKWKEPEDAYLVIKAGIEAGYKVVSVEKA